MNVLDNKLVKSLSERLLTDKSCMNTREVNVIRIWSNCLLHYLQSLYNTHPALANKPMKNNHGEENENAILKHGNFIT